MNKILKISSITKKLLVALLGSFLLLFLLFHMCANLCVLRNDGGQWYSNFCHFMGTNYVVKVFEVVLLGVFALHIVLTLWLWFTNRLARPVRYHQPSRTRTAKGSKLMILSGVLILICLGLHFYDFFLVKFGLQNNVSQYMVKTEDLRTNEAMQLASFAEQNGMSVEEFLKLYKEQAATYAAELSEDQRSMIDEQLEQMEQGAVVIQFMGGASDRISPDGKWIKQISAEERRMLESSLDNVKLEPDFYNMARSLFHNPVIAILYLLFFFVVGLHLRHAFESVFQTFGLNHYKYSHAIETAGVIYMWIICLGFAIVPLGVLLL